MIEPKAVIADDEKLLRTGLKIVLERLWPELKIVGEAKNGQEALEMIKDKTPDIAFLDIKMPSMTGLEVARQVYGQTKVVFVTAYDQYAVTAFEAEAVDYVLKPINEKRLGITIQRLKTQLHQPELDSNDLAVKMRKIIQVLENQQVPERLRMIKVKTGSEIRLIPVSQVLFFKSEDKYTIVQTAQNEFLIKTPLKDLEQELDPKQFWRVHRSAIVNIDRIHKIKRSFTNQMVIVFQKTDQTIMVSRNFEHLFRQI